MLKEKITKTDVANDLKKYGYKIVTAWIGDSKRIAFFDVTDGRGVAELYIDTISKTATIQVLSTRVKYNKYECSSMFF